MDPNFNLSLANSYKSPSQIARVLTETWVADNLYCPRCGHPHISSFPNNRAAADFFCPNCRNEFELKSKHGSLGKKVADGAYDTLIQRITSNNNPDFFFLRYSLSDLCVDDLFLVPKHFFTPAVVEKRTPLAETAKRAGWVGCNILLSQIPEQGRIALVRDRTPVKRELVQAKMCRSSLLQFDNIDARGWIMDILLCLDKIPVEQFSLSDMYQFETILATKHPNNRNIRPKIRQQLQVLRDKGLLVFLGRGQYKKAATHPEVVPSPVSSK